MWLFDSIPINALFNYLNSLESLSSSVGILAICVLLSGGIILFAVYGSSVVRNAELKDVSSLFVYMKCTGKFSPYTCTINY